MVVVVNVVVVGNVVVVVGVGSNLLEFQLPTFTF